MNKLHVKIAALFMIAVSCASMHASESGESSTGSSSSSAKSGFTLTSMASYWLATSEKDSWSNIFATAAVKVAPAIDATLAKNNRKEEIENNLFSLAGQIAALLPEEEAQRGQLIDQAMKAASDLKEVAGDAAYNIAMKQVKSAAARVVSSVPQGKILEFVTDAMAQDIPDYEEGISLQEIKNNQ